MDFGNEMEHLRQLSQSDKSELDENIMKLKTNNSSLSFGSIAQKLGTNKMKVKRVIDRNTP